MRHSNLELAQDRISGMQAAAAEQHEARRALIRGRALRRAARAERKALRFARAAQQIRARIAGLETGR
jgi:hypothetical protein